MTELTLYDGVAGVGGNKFLLEDKDVGLMFDFGSVSGDKYNKVYRGFLGPRAAYKLRDLFHWQFLPQVYGIYDPTLLEGTKIEVHDKPSISALFISHAHLDHFQFTSFLDPGIPVFCNSPTYETIKCFDRFKIKGSFFNQTIKVRRLVEIPGPKKQVVYGPDGVYMKIPLKKQKSDRFFEYRSYVRNFPRWNERTFKLGNLEVECHDIGHCIGAVGYIARAPIGNIIYTGDISFHGKQKQLSFDFMEKVAAADPKIALVDMTRLDETDLLTEDDVVEKSIAAINVLEKDKLALVEYGYRDAERFLSYKQVAEKTDREFVVSPEQINFVWYLENHFPGISARVKVYKMRKWTGLDLPSDYRAWERTVYEKVEVVEENDIRENPGRYLIGISWSDLPILIDVKPPHGSLALISTIEPWDESGYIDQEKKLEWYNSFGLKQEYVHAKHHMPQQHIKMFLEKTSPEIVVPIHSKPENLDLAREMFGSLYDVRILEEGVTYDLPSFTPVKRIEKRVALAPNYQTTLRNKNERIDKSLKRDTRRPRVKQRPKGVQRLDQMIEKINSQICPS